MLHIVKFYSLSRAKLFWEQPVHTVQRHFLAKRNVERITQRIFSSNSRNLNSFPYLHNRVWSNYEYGTIPLAFFVKRKTLAFFPRKWYKSVMDKRELLDLLSGDSLLLVILCVLW